MKNSSKISVKSICFTAIMAAIIFVFTFTFKIPLGTGYTHLGDSIIFLSIILLGTKKSSLAAGIGAALADLIGGYAAWILPTFVIKAVMVLICGLFLDKLIKNRIAAYFAGALTGGAFQILAYTLAKLVMYGKAYALTTLPELAIQTVVGITVGFVLVTIFDKTKITQKLKKTAQ